MLGLLLAIGMLQIPQKHVVQGLSMEPTLNEGDNLYYTKFQNPAYGDLIIFQTQNPKYGYMVKRVIGLEGDQISVNADGSVIRNGEPLIEPYIETDKLGNSAMAEVTVEKGKLFVLGDNRAVSVDSRDTTIGQISRESVYGTVTRSVHIFR
jgi:signal peptidase I